MWANHAVKAPWLVFTDLDGTLLEHRSYSAEPARPALVRLARAGIPVIFATSKTLSELRPLMNCLGISGPAVAENGSVLAFPPRWQGDSGTLQRYSPPYDALVARLGRLRENEGFRFQGFHDWSAQELARQTGLSRVQVTLARCREASEPILWQDCEDSLKSFRQRLADHGLKLIRGGRFHHVLGAAADKAHALQSLVSWLRAQGWKGRTIALGDAPNDYTMLTMADVPVIVRNPHTPEIPPLANPHVLHTAETGPVGWREAIENILSTTQGNHP